MSNAFMVGGSSNAWNYSDNSKDNYSEQLSGTVVEIRHVQALNFSTKQPEFWPDGNPKTNFRFMVLDTAGNEFAWTISTASKSNAMVAVMDAIDPNRQPGKQVDISQLLGKMVTITTQAGSYNSQRPRPWWVQIHGDGDVSKVRGCVDDVEERRAQIRQQGAQVANNQFTQQQQGAQVAMNAMQPQPAQPYPAQPQMMQQPYPAQPQQAQQPYPAQQVQPGVPVPTDLYEEEIPF